MTTNTTNMTVFLFSFIFVSWRLITSQHFSGFCHTLTWISHGVRKTSTSVLLTTPKPLTVWITTNWKILKEMGIPCHLIYLLRILYPGKEATVRTGCGTTDWFQIRKGVVKAVYCHPAYLTYIQSTSWETAGVDEVQAGIKIAGRNSSNLRCADDTTLMAESEEELKSLLMKVKEESEKVGLKLNIQ